MMKYQGLIILLVMPVISLASQPTIYKSTDDRGRVTYSSEPPSDAVEVEQLQVEQAPPEAVDQTSDRTQRMLDVARDFEMSRLEQERLREERRAIERQAALEEEQFKRQQQLLDQIGDSYNRGYYWPYRPIHIPRPEHPIVKPKPSRPVGGGHSGIRLPIHNR